MSKPKIFVDMDGTLAEWKTIEVPTQIPTDEIQKFIYDKLYQPDYFYTLKPHSNLIAAIQRIINESYTDIDYIGSDLSKDIQEEVINIGYKHGFGNDWINNDILLSGSTLEELEYATGKLHFEPKMQLKVITVNALSKKDLLRMKLIAIDTSYFGMRFGGEFTRIKDFKDIDLLLQDLDMSLTDLYVENMFYVANDTFDLIDYYINTKDETLFTKSFDEIQESVNDYIRDSYFKPDNEQDVEI